MADLADVGLGALTVAKGVGVAEMLRRQMEQAEQAKNLDLKKSSGTKSEEYVKKAKEKDGPTGSDKATAQPIVNNKKGGSVKSKVSSASKRADGCATKGKTRGRMI